MNRDGENIPQMQAWSFRWTWTRPPCVRFLRPWCTFYATCPWTTAMGMTVRTGMMVSLVLFHTSISGCQSVCATVLFSSPCVCSSVCYLSVSVCVSLSLSLSFPASLLPSVWLSVCLSLCLSVCLCLELGTSSLLVYCHILTWYRIVMHVICAEVTQCSWQDPVK